MHSVLLDRYDADELAVAVERHVARFYANSLKDEEREHLERIQQAVARGLPLRDVCTSPLLLRMLFVLYAPDKVPEEIHSFRLYDEYWNLRVRTDTRAGEPVSGADNLEHEACAVALMMLAEGTPEIDEALAVEAAANLRMSHECLERLHSRGILRRSGSSGISFFHQTFFEHSAARGLVRCFSEAGLEMLTSRLGRSWSDLFIAPVCEQFLLLTESMPGPAKMAGTAALGEMFSSSVLPEQSSAVYVYCHRRNTTPSLEEEVHRILKTGAAPIARHFLRLAPNLPHSRLKGLFAQLDIIWTRNNWAEQDHILELLERLAFRLPTSVRCFIENNAVVDFVIGSSSNAAAERKLARALAVLARTMPDWALDQFLTLLKGTWRRTAGLDAPMTVLGAMAGAAPSLGSDLASRTYDCVGAWHGEYVRGFEQLAQKYGKLWSLEWRTKNRSPREIICETSAVKDPFLLSAKMEAITELLSNFNKSDCAYLFSVIAQESDPFHKWQWVNIVVRRALTNGGQGSAIQSIQAWAAGILCEQSQGKGNGIRPLIKKMIWESALSSELFSRLIAKTDYRQPQQWLDELSLGRLLADGVLAGHPGATSAIAIGIAQPTKYLQILGFARHRLGERFQQSAQAVRDYLTLTLVLKEPSGLTNSLRWISDAYPEAIHERTAELNDLRRSLLESGSGKSRRAAIALWQELLELQLCETPSLSALFELFEREDHEYTRCALLLLIGTSAEKSTEDVEAMIARLRPIASSGDEGSRQNARLALISAVARSVKDAAAHGMAVLDVVLASPTDARIAGEAGRILSRLIESGSEQQLVACCRRILLSAGVVQLGTQSKRTLAHRLRSPIRAAVRALSKEGQHNIARMLFELDRFLGAIVLDAVCHEHFASVATLLNEVLDAPTVPSELKELIRREKYSRERTLGGKSWPELYRAMVESGRLRQTWAG